jgi:hypothetical protein
VVSHHQVVRDTAESGVARMITAMALLMPAELYLTFSEPVPGCVEISRRGAVIVAGGAG